MAQIRRKYYHRGRENRFVFTAGAFLIILVCVALLPFVSLLIFEIEHSLSPFPAGSSKEAPLSQPNFKRNIRKTASENEASDLEAFELPSSSWTPPEPSSDNVVIAIPFRSESSENYDLVMHRIQMLNHTIKNVTFHTMIVNEENASHFRRAWLLNVALLQAGERFSDETCFVVHDLDVLPSTVDTASYMSWCDRPTLVSSELSCYNGSLPHEKFSRGIIAARLSAWHRINGFTDSLYDMWGEDEDMYWRFQQNDLLTRNDTLRRPPDGSGRSICLPTPIWTHQGANQFHIGDQHRIIDRIERLASGSSEWKNDGLNSFSYQMISQTLDGYGSSWFRVSRDGPAAVDAKYYPVSKRSNNQKTVVIMIPYRDRKIHYRRFMAHIQRLRHRRLNYHLHVFVVEQMNDDFFRRGWLSNVGLHEISKRFKTNETCVVQHDVDLLPNLDTVDYSWCEKPQLVCSAIPCFGGGVPYASFSGGVVAASLANWRIVNGLTNEVWGWGAEDDELFHRFKAKNLLDPPNYDRLRRRPDGMGYCDCSNDKHHTGRGMHWTSYNRISDRIARMRKGADTDWTTDGYHTTKYDVVKTFRDEYQTLWIQANYSSDQHAPPCPDPNGPIPVVLMAAETNSSIGSRHSGVSSAMWAALSFRAGNLTSPTKYFEKNEMQVENFFRDNADGSWLADAICKTQAGAPHAAVAALKWNPVQGSLTMSGFIEALRSLPSLTPPVKVIRAVQNPLDVAISAFKYFSARGVSPCGENKSKCIWFHNESLPISFVSDKIRGQRDWEDEIDDALEKYKVPHLKVDPADFENELQWDRIFKFLGVAPTTPNCKQDQLEKPLNVSKRLENVLNMLKRSQSSYDEMKEALIDAGTDRILLNSQSKAKH